MQTRRRHLWEIIHTSFWFRPILMVMGAIVLAFTMLAVDAKLRPRYPLAPAVIKVLVRACLRN